MSLDEVASLIEREHRLHQEWLSALSSLEATLQQREMPVIPDVTAMLQEIMDQLTETQKNIMETVSKYSMKQALTQPGQSTPTLEHILTLYENIELLQQKITQKHQDLRMFHPLQKPSPSVKPVQLALDHSMDLLKHLINPPR